MNDSRKVHKRQLAERVWKINPDNVKVKVSKQSPLGSTKTVVCFSIFNHQYV